MPMIPSLVAAASYGALKIGAYAAYGYWLNHRLKCKVAPFKFGLVKTLVGLAFGFLLLAFSSSLPTALQADFAFWLSAFPLRLLAWLFVIGYFYGSKINKLQLLGYSLLGAIFSYALDLIMFALFNLLPGMQMPMC